MHEKLITSDQLLSGKQRQILLALVDTIVPASADGVMPGGGEMDFIANVSEQAPDFLPVLADILTHFDDAFATADLMTRYQQVQSFSEAEPTLFMDLLGRVYACYYQDARVLMGIGAGVGAPFPRGNEVEPGDLSLLDPVLASSITWRR
jgi:hypothetical protein